MASHLNPPSPTWLRHAETARPRAADGRARSLWAIVSLLLLLGLGQKPAPGQVSPPGVDRRAQREARYRAQQTMIQRATPLDVTTADQVFTLRVDNRHLAFASPLTEMTGMSYRQYKLGEPLFKDPSMVIVIPVRMVQGGGKPVVRFIFRTYSMPTPDELITSSVQATPGQVTVDQVIEGDSGVYRWNQLLQSDAADGSHPVRLTFTGRQGNPRTMTVEAPDFRTLLNDHPDLAEDPIRSMLRGANAENLMAPDSNVAWQVFADRWPAEGEAIRKVQGILPHLDEPDFRARDAAFKELETMSRAAAAALMAIDRAHFTPEQNRLVDCLLAPYRQLSAKDVEQRRSSAAFLLDCLNCDDSELRTAALETLRLLTKRQLSFAIDAAPAERAAAVALLRAELAPSTRPSPQTAPTTRAAER